MNKIYSKNHFRFIDKIVINKRKEMSDLIKKELRNIDFLDALDIGSTNDIKNESSNYLIKNLRNIKIYRSISNQKINSKFFSKTLTKSITDNFSHEEIENYSSDLVISNATIEHVGDKNSQIKMTENIIKLSKKIFVITTPNRFYPFDFHTKIPLIHWLPKKIHRKFLKIVGLDFFSKEQNLDLLSYNDLKNLIKDIKNFDIRIKKIKFLGLTSNLIIFGKKIT